MGKTYIDPHLFQSQILLCETPWGVVGSFQWKISAVWQWHQDWGQHSMKWKSSFDKDPPKVSVDIAKPRQWKWPSEADMEKLNLQIDINSVGPTCCHPCIVFLTHASKGFRRHWLTSHHASSFFHDIWGSSMACRLSRPHTINLKTHTIQWRLSKEDCQSIQSHKYPFGPDLAASSFAFCNCSCPSFNACTNKQTRGVFETWET